MANEDNLVGSDEALIRTLDDVGLTSSETLCVSFKLPSHSQFDENSNEVNPKSSLERTSFPPSTE